MGGWDVCASIGDDDFKTVRCILLSERDIDSTPLSGPDFATPPGDMQITYDSAHSFIPYVNSYHARRSRYCPPPSSLSNNTMRAPSLILKQRISIILCKKHDKVDTRALAPKSYQTHCVCKDFNIKTLKNQCFFTKNFANFLPARSC